MCIDALVGGYFVLFNYFATEVAHVFFSPRSVTQVGLDGW